MSQLQDLRARMRLDNAQFSRGLRQARGEAQSFGRSLTAMFRAVAAPLAGALSFRAIAQGARRGAEEIDQVAKSARALDGSIGAVRAAELALKEAGVSASVFRTEMQNLNREVASGGADAAMRALGIRTQEFIRLDADEKIALIADRVKELGLDAGSTNAVLRQFGVRNRDMALVVMQGGDAIRDARRDIEAYGLAISAVDSARIEEAQDRIGRLSVVGQYLRQELALQLTPALGEFARMLTESMREGGALRGVIDGLVGLVPRLTAYVGAATGAAVLYGTAMAGVATAKWLVVGATNGLRAALVRLGLPVLILAAGEMIHQFGRLVKATGGWGEALDLLRQVASSVWEGIKLDARALEPALGAVWKDIQAGFFTMLEEMTRGFGSFMRNFEPLAALPEWGVTAPFRALGDVAVVTTAAVDGFSNSASRAAGQADQLRAQSRQLSDAGLAMVTDALEKLRAVMDRATEDGDEFEGSIREIYRTLEDLSGGGGGGSGGARGAAAAIDDVTRATEDATRAQEQWAQSMAGHFDGLITGAKGLQGVLQSIARQLESSGWQMLFQGLGGIFGGGVGAPLNAMGSGPLAGFRADGGPVNAGLSYIVGERGPELFTPRASGNITSNEAMRRGGMGGHLIIELRGDIDARIAQGAENVVIRRAPGIVSDAVGATYRAAEEVPIGVR